MTAGLCLIPPGLQVSNKQGRQLGVSITRARESTHTRTRARAGAYRKVWGGDPCFLLCFMKSKLEEGEG